jgi:hypothetical protein
MPIQLLWKSLLRRIPEQKNKTKQVTIVVLENKIAELVQFFFSFMKHIYLISRWTKKRRRHENRKGCKIKSLVKKSQGFWWNCWKSLLYIFLTKKSHKIHFRKESTKIYRFLNTKRHLITHKLATAVDISTISFITQYREAYHPFITERHFITQKFSRQYHP